MLTGESPLHQHLSSSTLNFIISGASSETCPELPAGPKGELPAGPSAGLSAGSCQEGDQGCQTSLWQTWLPLILEKHQDKTFVDITLTSVPSTLDY